MKIVITSDHFIGVADKIAPLVKQRGHEVILGGALIVNKTVTDWAKGAADAAHMVADGKVDQAIICCFTGTGASIAANKVNGVRAALCTDAFNARGARMWNDANVLVLSLRLTSDTLLEEILEAWFGTTVVDTKQKDNIDYINKI